MRNFNHHLGGRGCGHSLKGHRELLSFLCGSVPKYLSNSTSLSRTTVVQITGCFLGPEGETEVFNNSVCSSLGQMPLN